MGKGGDDAGGGWRSGFVGRIEVRESASGRREWPEAVKGRIVRESLEPGASVKDVAQRHAIAPVAALNYSDGAKGGRPPFDPVLMFKVLVIQAQNNLSDDRAEFLINDRLSFMQFLGLGLGNKVPDAKTIWAFRERLTKAGAIEVLFARFDRAIREAGYIPMSGQIVDASLVSAPKQRNTEGEKEAIKEGRIPEEWKAKPAKLRQKDRDARWTLVFGRHGCARTGRGTPTSRSRSSATSLTPASTAGTASSASGT
jgi:transposase